MSEGPDLPGRPDPALLLIEISEVEDRIEVLRKERGTRTRNMITLALVTVAFVVLGFLYGTPGFVIAAFLAVYQIVPYGRHMMASEQLRRAEGERDRLLEARDSVGDSEVEA